ncbi:hypothetical protein C4D60_Mb03t01970 [Musa balbisiana]|uniref:Uncharacterized protein n=1 Tax=Musa balbisiana TaxID=52838 RepID=A0A4S8J6Z7_MUSBA|nr:hypothetical protein C4D60_Mb03t01970 [Musa balbisiana]
MERKQGFFSALREEVARGLSPGRSRSENQSTVAELLLPRRWRRQPPRGFPDELLVPASGSLAPLAEGPEGDDLGRRKEGWGRWVKGQLSRAPSAFCRSSDLRFLLGVMGAPLAPVHVSPTNSLPPLSIKDTPIETSTAQYILQQYTAATGGLKLLSSIRNSYAMGKVTMVVSEFETASRVIKHRNSPKDAESGGFVLWQMAPDMWYVELAIGGSKVHAGCNGKLVWRHTPCLGAHAATGSVRPLRRALQGLDPLAVVNVFADAQCIGEKKIDGEDCFILKLCADPQTLKARSEGSVEIIRHVFFGYFSQKTGLLTCMEDSHLTRIQSSAGGDAVYWETTINSRIHDYRPVEGMMIAHSGHSVVTLFRFGEVAMSHTKTRMEEVWSIEEVAFNVPGLSMDCFIPPADVKDGSVSEAREVPPQAERGRSTMAGSHRAKVAALEKSHDVSDDNIWWRVEV